MLRPMGEEIWTATGTRLCDMLFHSIDGLNDHNLRRLLIYLFDLLDEQACEEAEL